MMIVSDKTQQLYISLDCHLAMEEFKEVYTKTQSEKIASEFSRLKDNCYLEHAGATLYSDVQISKIFEDLQSNLFGNPHAFNTSSKFTEDIVDQIRFQVLEHFNTNPDEYSLIFTSGATAALKLVAENFNYSNNGIFMYLQDNHTSVLGMRECAKTTKILPHDDAFKIFKNNNYKNSKSTEDNSLFVYPAQCNFSGTKYPLSWIEKIQNGILNNYENSSKWFCMLDAASFVSCNKLDLNIFKPDFVCLSFYKIFGYPTGLGALLVKNSSGYILKKNYFGGGTVQMALDTEHILRPVLHERFEDGTLSFLSIAAVRHGFETLKRLSLNIDLISLHTFALAKYVHNNLLTMHHKNENPVAILYHDTNFKNRDFQGGIVNFNLLRSNGAHIGFSEVLHMANLYKIHLRTGCFCNPGSCQRHLELSSFDVKQQFNAGHVCGDQNDLIDGYPTGSVRISFGYMSTKQDADKLLQMIEDCFVSLPIVKKIPKNWEHFQMKYEEKFSNLNNNYIVKPKNIQNSLLNQTEIQIKEIKIENGISVDNVKAKLEYIFVYPIKSCGPYSVLNKWKIEPTGLIYDREWMIVTLAGVCLTQKQNPKLCLIMPDIKLDEGILELNFPGMQPAKVSLDISEIFENAEVSMCQSKVCGDRVKCIDCGDEIANWICEALQRSDLRLLRQNSNHIRTNRKGQQSQLSLVNQAQYLLLNTASAKFLANSIPDREENEEELYNLLARFRANLVINCDAAFVEKSCQEIEIGGHVFKCTGPCTRCQMICIDQTTGEKTIEPLRTLSVLTESKIRFGIYLAHLASTDSHISINDKVIFNSCRSQ